MLLDEIDTLQSMTETAATGFQTLAVDNLDSREVSAHQESQTSCTDGGNQNSKAMDGKKKKRKNKKKKAGQVDESNANMMNTCKENFFDKTLSTANEGEGMSDKVGPENETSNNVRDFTPLREKLGTSL